MERKERNAEEKTSACQIPSFISAIFYKISTKKLYISNVIIFKNEKVFSKMIFLKQVKKCSQRSMVNKMSSCNLT
jgi:hypothetical protein